MNSNDQPPVVIEFVSGSRISQAEIHQLQHTAHAFVTLKCGGQIKLPADQIVLGEDTHGSARVGLGGMSFEGLENEHLVFWRVRDLYPDEQLHPQREMKLTLDPSVVSAVILQGTQVWPRNAAPKTKASRPRAC